MTSETNLVKGLCSWFAYGIGTFLFKPFFVKFIRYPNILLESSLSKFAYTRFEFLARALSGMCWVLNDFVSNMLFGMSGSFFSFYLYSFVLSMFGCVCYLFIFIVPAPAPRLSFSSLVTAPVFGFSWANLLNNFSRLKKLSANCAGRPCLTMNEL